MKRDLTCLSFPENAEAAERLATMIDAVHCPIQLHVFPDGETMPAFSDEIGPDVAVMCSLDRPNSKFLPLVFAARAARDRGAKRVGLVAPYLPYMRQDKHFVEGDVISARIFANELSGLFDWLVTVDPHLHRIKNLSEIFNIPSEVAHSAPSVSHWIATNIEKPILIGPDSESDQWVRAVADLCHAPYTTLQKKRCGDRDVAIAGSETLLAGRQPVLIDDIVSTAETMAKAVEYVRSEGHERPFCIAVHALFAPGAMERLTGAGPKMVVTTNTITHPSNRIDTLDDIACAVLHLLDRAA